MTTPDDFAEHPAQRALDRVLALARQMQATSGQCFVFEAGDRIVRAIQESRAIPQEVSEPVEVATSHYRSATPGGDAARIATSERVEAAARALFGEVTGAPFLYDSLDEGAQRTWRGRAAAVLADAGFTVVGED